MNRSRSEYRLALPSSALIRDAANVTSLRPFASHDRETAADLLLDAYRGTIDDEGETETEALEALDHHLAVMEPSWSFVLPDDEGLVAMSLVVTVGGLQYIDPVVTRSAHKRQGLGRLMVCASIAALEASGASEIGAVITDGNTPSECLFNSLGFVRQGSWG